MFKAVPYLVTIVCLLSPFSALSQPLEDVIYKKDGSVLRGTLIEQDFANGKYKIQLQGGSVFSIDKDDIEKISKEAPLSSHKAASGTNINIHNSPSINQTTQAQSAPIASQKDKELHVTRGTLYIGTMTHTLKTSTILGESKYTYSGLNLAGQLNVSRHFALYSDLNIGSFSEKEETDNYGNTYTYSGSSLVDENYSSVQVAAILSTNLYEGWQFFTGFGGFRETYKTDNDTFTATGSSFQLGLGYSWQTLQLILRINILNSSDYSDAVDTSDTGHLQLGFNF